jgi:hypothetical protein
MVKTVPLLGAVIAPAMLWGCARPSIDCTGGPSPECEPTFGPCAADVDPCRYVPAGATNTLVEIDSFPTPAEIFIDGAYVGRTPLKRYLWFSSRTPAVNVVAEPLYPGQARQKQRLNVPPLPKRLTFFMNNPAESEASGEAAR